MKVLLRLAALLLFVSPVYADVFDHPLKDSALLARTIYSPDALSGSFTQTRQISSMGITLNSTGEFALDKKEGVLWRTLSPMENSLVIKGSRICTTNANGSKSVDLSENEAATEVLTVINSIFTQEYEKASTWFDFYFEIENGAYTLGLIAKDKTMAKVIERMTVYGAKYAEKIVLSAQNGDITTIIFANVTETAPAISCP
jgi:outer membrane lipoprotein-sorting protein